MKNLYKVLALAGAMAFGAVSFAEGLEDSPGVGINEKDVKVIVVNQSIKVTDAEGADVAVYSLNGKKVNPENVGAKGIFIVVVKKGDNVITKKVVVK